MLNAPKPKVATTGNAKRFGTKLSNQRAGSKASNTFATLVRNAAVAFTSADVNNDDQLSFEEFSAMIKSFSASQKHQHADLREIFSTADADNNGAISRDEFFFWCLEWATLFSGNAVSGIEEMFRKFDASGDGELNLLEFHKVTDLLGFGSKGHEIFMALDKEGAHSAASGSVPCIPASIQCLRHYRRSRAPFTISPVLLSDPLRFVR